MCFKRMLLDWLFASVRYCCSAAYRLLRHWPGKPLIDAETGGELIDAEVLGIVMLRDGSNSRVYSSHTTCDVRVNFWLSSVSQGAKIQELLP